MSITRTSRINAAFVKGGCANPWRIVGTKAKLAVLEGENVSIDDFNEAEAQPQIVKMHSRGVGFASDKTGPS